MKLRIHFAWAIAFIVSLLLNGTLAYFLISCHTQPCAEVLSRKWTDTVYVNENKVPATVEVSKAKVKPKKVYSTTPAGTGTVVSLVGEGASSRPAAPHLSLPAAHALNIITEGPCNDSVYVFERIFRIERNYTATLVDTFQHNEIIGWSFTHKNLKPQITEHEVIVKKPKVAVYIGAFGGFSRPYNSTQAWNWTLGPEVFISTPMGLMAGYGFDAKNNGHTVHLNYKIRLK